MRIHVAGGLHRGEIVRAVEDHAGGLDPVVVEGGLHLRHHRALDAEVQVAPVVGVLRMAFPLVGDADAAGESHRAVDHQQLAMGAIVEAADVVPLERPVLLDVDAGVAHALEQVVLHLDAAGPVQHHVDLDAGSRALGEGVGVLGADVAGPVDVGLEGDGLLRRANAFDHGGEDLVAVLQILDAVATHDGGA